jgi:hypothetical protein
MYADVLIIGAGPCGLAAAARLFEATPSALFTDEEHARYWKQHNRKETLQNELREKQCRRNLPNSSSNASPGSDSGYDSADEALIASDGKRTYPPSVVVLDATSSTWLGQWHARFADLKIQHLRSPLFFHPDPRDRDGLLSYAYEQGREAELTEIPNVANGKEYSKHALKQQQKRHRQKSSTKAKIEPHLRVDGRDRIDYFTPSTSLFRDYCSSIISRYNLADIVQQARVTCVTHSEAHTSAGHPLFTVTTSNNSTYYARAVIVAAGPSSLPPALPPNHSLYFPATPSTLDAATSAATHIFAPSGLNLRPSLTHKLTHHLPTHILIVGGGLSSFQLAASLLNSHPHSYFTVTILIRSRYKLKPFDVDLLWVSKLRNQRMAAFYSADEDEERSEMVRDARGGGSVTPLFDREVVQKLRRGGRLRVLEGRVIGDGNWVHDEGGKAVQGRWRVSVVPTAPQRMSESRSSISPATESKPATHATSEPSSDGSLAKPSLKSESTTCTEGALPPPKPALITPPLPTPTIDNPNDSIDVLHADHIFFATGLSQPSPTSTLVDTLPFLAPLFPPPAPPPLTSTSSTPIPRTSLPHLTTSPLLSREHSIPYLSDTLQVRLPPHDEGNDLPLFLTGALAALQLGPGAANLAGARMGAERVAWGLEKLGIVGEGYPYRHRRSPGSRNGDSGAKGPSMRRGDGEVSQDQGGAKGRDGGVSRVLSEGCADQQAGGGEEAEDEGKAKNEKESESEREGEWTWSGGEDGDDEQRRSRRRRRQWRMERDEYTGTGRNQFAVLAGRAGTRGER